MDLYVHSPIRLHGVGFNELSTGTTLPFLCATILWDVTPSPPVDHPRFGVVPPSSGSKSMANMKQISGRAGSSFPTSGSPYVLHASFWLLGLLFDHDDGGNTFLRNVELHSYRCENTKSNTDIIC
jgi:hypothetical protein